MNNIKKYSGRKIERKLIRLILCFQFILLPSLVALGQEIEEYLAKSAFLLKVPVFIEWPSNANYNDVQNNFEIAIIGEDPFNGKLESIIKSKSIKIKNKNVIVKMVKKIEEIGGTDILFISNSEKYNLSKILNYVKDKPVLTFSDTRSFTDKGVMINMYVEERSIVFNANLLSSNASKIYISSKLLAHANKVIK